MAETKFGFQIGSSLATQYLTDSKYIRAGYTVVQTKADLNNLPVDSGSGGVTVKGSLAYVSNDSTASNNGSYRYNGSQWVKENDVGTTVPSGAVFTDTTYTFNTTAQTNKIQYKEIGAPNWTDIPININIANNITGSGASGYIAKFNGTNTITNGPQFGNDTTTFLNNKGEWTTPTGTYSLPKADSSTLGGIKTGYSTSDKNYAIQVDSNGNAYVNVPWTDTLDATSINGLKLLDQSYAYLNQLDISIGCVNAVVNTGLTESQIFALTGNLYGKLYLASDTNKYYRCKNSGNLTTASSTYWRNDTTAITTALALPNQLTTEDAIYIRINTNQQYYSKLPKFFVMANYDNISGSTQITGFCRQQNQFEITSCSYNGNNLVGIYQPSANTNIYVFKFTKYRSNYGATNSYNAPITIYTNESSGTPTIEFIGINHADYNTVKGYNYITVPTYGIKGTSIYDTLLPINTNSKDLGSNSLKWKNVYATTFYGALSGNATTATGLAGTANPHYIYAGPSSGTAPAAPSFRPLIIDDIPSLTKSKISDFPTNISSFTNDSGYITGITNSMVTTALGYTPYNSTNPNGYTTNTGTVTSITLKAGAGITLDTDNTAITTSGNRTISIDGLDPSNGSISKVLSKKGDWVDLPTASSLGLSSAMLFKGSLGIGGTITSLPIATNENIGYTYKVITKGTYQSIAAEIGDVFVSTGSTWILIPSGDEPSGTVTSITLKAGNGIILDTDNTAITESGIRTISHADTSTQTSITANGRKYITGITLDNYGHVTGLTTGTETVTNTDRYVNSATFTDDSITTAASPVKMVLTRAGSDTQTVIANIPKVSDSSAGVVPKGTAVNLQNQTTKFLREDGSWAIPSYSSDFVDLTSDQTIDGIKTFVKRPLISGYVELPAGYTQLEYIMTTTGAYIDTGRHYSTNDTVEFAFQQSDSNTYRIWGTFNQSGYEGPNVSMTYAGGWAVRQETVAGSTRMVSLPAINANKHRLQILSNGNVKFDDVEYARSAGWAANYTFNYNAYLFTINPGNTTPSATMKGKIYYYKVWDSNGNLVQDMYPVYNGSSYGMYDIVSETFYTNANPNTNSSFTGGGTPLSSEFLIASDLASVSFSGNYNDLLNKPTIPTGFTISANSTDGLWDITGTGGINQISYSLNPYTTKQSFAAFYTQASNPTLTTRLNYDGYLYATKLYSNGSEVLTSFTEIDPTVPAWAKAATKPSYTWSEISNKPTHWANIDLQTAAAFNKAPEVATIRINGNTSATQAAAAGAACTLVYNTSTKALDFNFV